MTDDPRSTDERVLSPDRRRILRTASELVAGATLAQSLGGAARAQEAHPPATSPSEPLTIAGFERVRVTTRDGTTIQTAVAIGKSAARRLPPLLLLHGAPLTHYTWRDVAPELAKRYSVVAADLRGYGDSDQPQGLPDHSNYSKRAMAQDQVDVMKHFGFDRFAVVGQDRGGRVAQRMALDHPDAVTKLVLIDIVPTYYLYTHVTIGFVQAYFHWFNFLQASPIPENQLLAQRDAQAARPISAAQAEYRRRNATPAGVHAMCEDYRAGASIDLEHDHADLDEKIRCPVNVLWAEGGAMAKLYDVLSIWRERAKDVTGKGMPGGHNMQEGAPAELLGELQRFLSA